MEPFTKEELKILMEVQAKATEQMVLVAEKLKSIAETQEKINNRLMNGIVKELVEQFCREANNCRGYILKDLDVISGRTKEIKESVAWLKILWGLLALGVFLAGIIIKVV